MPGMLWRRRCLLNAAYSTHNTQNILSPPQDIAARGPFRSNATAREYLGAVNQQGASNEVLNGHATNRNFDVDIARYTRGAVRPGGGGESLRSVGVSLGGVWQHLCDAVERGHRLHERYDGQRGECELRGELVDAGRESHEQQWRCWQRAAVDLERVLLGLAGAIGFRRAAWSASATYTGGMVVSVGPTNYVANWWTQGQNPSSNNGGPGGGQPWTPQGSCSTSGSGTLAPGGGSTSTVLSATGSSSTGGSSVDSPGPASTGGSSTTGGAGSGSASGSAPDSSPVSAPPSGSGSGSIAPPAAFVFSAYKDISVAMNWNTNVISSSVTGSNQAVTRLMSTANSTLTWAFASGECGSENWVGSTPAQVASNVQGFVNARMKYILSTGGADGMFQSAGSDAGFDTFIQTYYSANLAGVDFDIEGGQSGSVISNLVSRVQAAEARDPKLPVQFHDRDVGWELGADLELHGRGDPRGDPGGWVEAVRHRPDDDGLRQRGSECLHGRQRGLRDGAVRHRGGGIVAQSLRCAVQPDRGYTDDRRE